MWIQLEKSNQANQKNFKNPNPTSKKKKEKKNFSFNVGYISIKDSHNLSLKINKRLQFIN